MPANDCPNCGGRAIRDFQSEHPRQSHGDTWPRVENGVGVMPYQVDKARDAARKSTVPCRFTDSGGRVFDNKQHWNNWHKAAGFEGETL